MSYFDPYVHTWSIDGVDIPRQRSIKRGLQGSHVSVLVQDHAMFDGDLLASSSTPIFDTRGFLMGPNIIRM